MSASSPAEGGELACKPSGSRVLAALVLLFVLPLTLRLVPIGHGMPRNYVHDSHVVRNALGMLRDRHPVPPTGRYSSYPYLIPYMLVPIYAAHFAVGLGTGAWSSPEEYGQVMTADASSAHLLARILVALFGALTPWVVFLLARELGLRRGAWVAALLVSTSLLHLHFSVQERPWVPMSFFFALSGLAAVRYGRRGDIRWLAFSGGAAGLAFACHQAGILAAFIPISVWLIGPFGWSSDDLRRRLRGSLVCAAAFVATALLLGHPYLLVHGPTATEAVIGGDDVHFAVGSQGMRFIFRLETAPRMGMALLAHDPVLALLALIGLAAALRQRNARPLAIFLVAWLLFFGFHESEKPRYLLPAVPFLALPAAFVAERLTRTPRGIVLTACVLALPLVQSVRLGAVLARADTRAFAEQRVPQLLPPGARLAIDRYGPPFELDLESLERLADLRARTGRQLEIRERARLERLREGREPVAGIDGIFLQDLFELAERDTLYHPRGVHVRQGLEDLGTTLEEVLAKTGCTHLLYVDRTAPGGKPHLLADSFVGREPILVIEPWSGLPLRREATLPMTPGRPWLSIWGVERPGPWMALYELDPPGGRRRPSTDW